MAVVSFLVILPSFGLYRNLTATHLSSLAAAGFVFAGMAVVSFLVILPASRVSDRLGRKWTIVPSAVAMASALLLMAAAGVRGKL
jgi:MFS family permease